MVHQYTSWSTTFDCLSVKFSYIRVLTLVIICSKVARIKTCPKMASPPISIMSETTRYVRADTVIYALAATVHNINNVLYVDERSVIQPPPPHTSSDALTVPSRLDQILSIPHRRMNSMHSTIPTREICTNPEWALYYYRFWFNSRSCSHCGRAMQKRDNTYTNKWHTITDGYTDETNEGLGHTGGRQKKIQNTQTLFTNCLEVHRMPRNTDTAYPTVSQVSAPMIPFL